MNKIFLHTFPIIFLILVSAICAQDLRNVKIGIVYSEKTKQLIYPQNKDFYPIQDWELFFLNRKISYTVINDEQLDDNEFDFLDVLILPSVEVLSENAKENLQNFLNEGKGLLIFGKIGLYDKDGKKTYSNYLSELGGFSVNEFNTKGKIAERHTIQYSSVLGRNINVDNDLLILNQFQPLAADVTDKDIIQLGKYVLDSDNEKQTITSGIVLSEQNTGRIVWFGFQLSQIIGNKAQENTVEKLIFNSIEWLSPIPFLMLKPLSGKYNVPVIISNIIIDTKSISITSLEQYYLNNVNANFFIDANEFDKPGNELSKFAAAGDINLFLNKNFSEEYIISTSLESLYDRLKLSSRQKYFGIKLNNTQLIQTSDESIISPFTYYLLPDNSLYTSEEKKIIGSASSFLVSKNNYQETLKSFSSFYKNAEKNGETVFINFIDQTKWGSKSIDDDLFSSITEYLKNQNAWITTYSDLIDWELSRKEVVIKTKRTYVENKFEIRIENHSQNEIKNAAVQLILPAGKFNPKLSRTNLHLEYNTQLKSYLIIIPYLQAGTKQSFDLEFGGE
ncbi:MAG: hypothetical protein IH784_06580 [Bacteroidetes bacterium]|nr:hypothetical protein [Bacteroidota bacterium]